MHFVASVKHLLQNQMFSLFIHFFCFHNFPVINMRQIKIMKIKDYDLEENDNDNNEFKIIHKDDNSNPNNRAMLKKKSVILTIMMIITTVIITIRKKQYNKYSKINKSTVPVDSLTSTRQTIEMGKSLKKCETGSHCLTKRVMPKPRRIGSR